ncbi:YjbF family lipoprotein [Stagnihabitans tardus]|uniref:Group 4 capsule polysaccharide lipoprotein gfcB, YjbF n=1 Tax=Stagnihabitans tardus TaxID=2699202 RepID=A0AAE5BUJ2_9RHOB|nr:YjbF family lipoprotein [Stagnihabitans tardus]NBZ86854.1 hypothetical protein [Stagnihabitans tardus]
MMRKLVMILALGLSLQGCGNTPDRADAAVSLKAIARIPALLAQRSAGDVDPAQLATLREALEADGQPVISVALPGLKYASLMAPYYPSRDAMTWSSPGYETVTLKDGILQSSRGFGPDLMASAGPGIAQVSAASGSVHRVYEYLNGLDVPVQMDYDCDFAAGGAQRVTVLDQVYDTRLVVETCYKGADRFENRYWFDKGGKIRQSEQRLSPGTAPMLIQRIVD